MDEDRLCIPRRLRSFDFLLGGLKGEGRVRGPLVGEERGGGHAAGFDYRVEL